MSSCAFLKNGLSYRLNVCVPLKFLCWKPMSIQVGLCEVIKIRWCYDGGAFMNGISIFTWDSRELAFSLCSSYYEVTRRSWQSVGKKRVLTRTWPCWYPDLGFPISGTTRNTYLLFINTCVLLSWAFTKHWKKLLAEVREVCKMGGQKNMELNSRHEYLKNILTRAAILTWKHTWD